MGKKQVNQYLKAYINRLTTDLSPCKVILYGSLAKDTYRLGESDIDLLVVSKKFEAMDEDERFDYLYKKTTGFPLDWHVYGLTPKEAANISPLNTLSEALRTGKILVE